MVHKLKNVGEFVIKPTNSNPSNANRYATTMQMPDHSAIATIILAHS
jgi:hypothetical protein